MTFPAGIVNFLSSKYKAQQNPSQKMHSRRLTVGTLILMIIVLLVAGCQSPAADAQKLLAERKFQEVMDKYPDSQFARRARALLAEDMLEAGKFEEVLKNFPDTRAAFLAREEQAKTLFNNKEYARLLAEFPNSPLATDAQNVLAQELHSKGMFDELLAKYPNSELAKRVKEERAAADLEAAKKMRGDKQIEALEKIMRSYTETPSYKEASTLLREARAKQK